MAARVKTVLDLLTQVRDKLDEENNANLVDADILAVLNRAQDTASNILARQYDTPLISYKIINVGPESQEYPIPSDAFEDRVEKVELRNQGTDLGWAEVPRISFRDATQLDTRNSGNTPRYVCLNKIIRFVPALGTARQARIWYMREPEPLVLPQGRITVVNTPGNYLLVDTLGDEVSADIESLEAFVNIVDGQSGVVRQTLQVRWVEGQKVKFKSIVDWDEVEGRTVEGTLSTEVKVGDYICGAAGSCIPFMSKPLGNYLIQYAVVELRQKLGDSLDVLQGEMSVLKGMEEALERTWVGREASLKVKRTNPYWRTNPLRLR